MFEIIQISIHDLWYSKLVLIIKQNFKITCSNEIFLFFSFSFVLEFISKIILKFIKFLFLTTSLNGDKNEKLIKI